jgi:LPS export ABC transporter protein LptC
VTKVKYEKSDSPVIAFFLPVSLQGGIPVIDYGMKTNRAVWFLSVLLVAAAFFIIFYDEKDVKILPSYKISTMENLKLTHRKGADIKWELMADRATMPVGEKKVYLESIRVEIRNDPDIRIKSGSGIYELQEGDITLNRTVTMHMKDAEFRTDSLNWSSDENMITTSDPVLVTGPSFRISGSGLTANVDARRVRINSDVKAVFYYN